MRIQLGLLAVALLCEPAATAFPITYTDSTFNLTDYSILQGSSNGTGTFTNPAGTFLATTVFSGSGFLGFAAINSSFSYNPVTMGALSTSTPVR